MGCFLMQISVRYHLCMVGLSEVSLIGKGWNISSKLIKASGINSGMNKVKGRSCPYYTCY